LESLSRSSIASSIQVDIQRESGGVSRSGHLGRRRLGC
jgi:hypothetical protein